MKKAIIISAIVIVVIAVAVVSALCFREKLDQLKFNGGEILFTESVSMLKVHKLGKHLVNSGFFDGTVKTLKLDKLDDKYKNDKYKIRLVIKPGNEKDLSYVNTIERLAYDLFCGVFDSTSIEIHLCDEEFKTLKTVKCREGYSVFGQKLEFNGSELYYQSVGKYWATKLGKYLVKNKFFTSTPKTTQLTKSGKIYEFKIVVQGGIEEDQNYINEASRFTQELSHNVFENAQMEIHLCDDSLRTVKIVK